MVRMGEFALLRTTSELVSLSYATLLLKAAAKKMVKQGVQGRIIFTGSTLSYMSFVGYSSYSPGKYALRGTYTAMIHLNLVAH